MDIEFDELYREIILDHYRNPRGFREISDEEALVDEDNPACGDHIKLVAELDGDRIAELAVHCEGCAICTASSSILAETAPGMRVDEAHAFAEGFIRLLRGEGDMSDDELGDLAAFRGVAQFPLRVKCATMPWHALHSALNKLTGR